MYNVIIYVSIIRVRSALCTYRNIMYSAVYSFTFLRFLPLLSFFLQFSQIGPPFNNEFGSLSCK